MWCVYVTYNDEEEELIHTDESEKNARQVMYSMVMNDEFDDDKIRVEYKEGHYKLNSYRYSPLRSDFESIFRKLLEELQINARIELWDMSIDKYEKYVKLGISSEGESYEYIENDTFKIMPFYWGDDDEITNLPNFEFKPYDFKLQFYKYAMRSVIMNQDITDSIFEEMINICVESLKEENLNYD